MSVPLSVLDLIPIPAGGGAREAFENGFGLARLTESLGFTRYWVAEHHNTQAFASASPELVLALLGRETRRMRLGAGGIMLPNHSPLKVAEWFRTLEALYPGRIDLGLGRAPGTDQLTALALRRATARLAADDFPEQVEELMAYAGEAAFPEGLPFAQVQATPESVPLPPLWLLSSSGFGARLAARLGRPFAFAHHFSPDAAEASLSLYRAEFQPSKYLARPYAILTVSAICAETEERAEALARTQDLMWIRFRRNERALLPTPEEARDYPYSAFEQEQARAARRMLTWGTPERVRDQLLALAQRLGADELMVATHLSSHEERCRSYSLLAQAFGLSAGAQPG